MHLEVKGMDKAKGNFTYIWGMYVNGFRPEHHCLKCLVGTPYKEIGKDMIDKSYPLSTDSDYFYLCAGGLTPRRKTNVHLVVRHQPGAVASVGSMCGTIFTIWDACAIQVTRLPEGWRGLEKGHATCRNFQFGVQAYGYHPKDAPVSVGDHSPLQERFPIPENCL